MKWRTRTVETQELLIQSREALDILNRLVERLEGYTERIETELAQRGSGSEQDDDTAE